MTDMIGHVTVSVNVRPHKSCSASVLTPVALVSPWPRPGKWSWGNKKHSWDTRRGAVQDARHVATHLFGNLPTRQQRMLPTGKPTAQDVPLFQ